MQKRFTVFLICLFFSEGIVYAQNLNVILSVRFPIQYEIQKEEITYGPHETQNASAVNFGIDVLASSNISKLVLFTGLGYFKNKINITRPYDHQLLNAGNDSLSILTRTKNYTYSLIRVPLGIEVPLFKKQNFTLSTGVEHQFSFCFKQKYNGGKPFEDAKDSHASFRYFGNNFQFFIGLKIKNHANKVVSIQPYIRLINNYKEDVYLFERQPERNKKYFDAFGLALIYDLTK